MLVWLERTLESFVPGAVDAQAERFRLPVLTAGQILRWDTRALHAALETQRRALHLTWTEVAQHVGGFTQGMLMNLAKGGRIGFPRVTRIVTWLEQPAVTFTRIADW